ncbi:MAN2B1 [Cordylochernes scorpioides]|uniref:Alpha-mannosidase n=1 Tax=Cordylochernes scorpioides TaxID=51811 RepID=A0ABY6KJX2_9ARAC|nr:MAN2B1 [Cordylochernes scorpioides]
MVAHVTEGQLHFAGGGWSMNDEACPLYPSIIDNMSWGLRMLNDTFGPCGRPLVTWQIDPFGHSREQASLFAQEGPGVMIGDVSRMFRHSDGNGSTCLANMYMDGLFLGRIDYQDKSTRKDNLTMEMLWKASSNLGKAENVFHVVRNTANMIHICFEDKCDLCAGESSHLFTGVLPNSYSPPNGFNFDILSNDAPLMDDPELEDYNIDVKVEEFLSIMSRQKDVYKTNHLIVTMGNDFNYQDAGAWFTNLDTLIKHINAKSGKWHKAFKEGREEVADEPRSGRQTTARIDENVDRVLEVLRTDRRLSIQQIADTLHMSTFVVHGIVTEDLQMRKVCAKLVPKVLTQDQKELRVLRCQEFLDLIQNEPGFLNSVITGDESWMFEYDPESKRQSCAWHTKSSPRPKKARMSKSRIKTMSIVFFDIRGIVHCEFVPQGQTVNSAFYLEVLRRLKRRIARVRTDIKDTVKLHHDNATSHTAFIITNFLARSNTPVIPHLPYSPDLAPCDFFLFPRLKREMKGKHWETVESIQHHVTTFLRSIPVEELQGAFQAWQTRLRKYLSEVDFVANSFDATYVIINLRDILKDVCFYLYIICWTDCLLENCRLLTAVNGTVQQANGSLWNAFYSTPHCYLYGLNQANQSWSSKADDFFPYASDPHAYWTGYFSSRPAFKGYVKDAQAFLQVVKQQYVLGELSTSYISLLDVLRNAVSVGQHHDAITGTAKQLVDYDYTQRLSRGMAAGQLISSLALRNLMRKSDITPPLQSYCPHLNISSCAVSESDTDFTVTAYNPLTLPVDTYVNVPVKTTLLEVFDSEGYPVKAQVAHPGLDKAAPYNLAFLVSLPALGYRTYFVKMINSIADPCSLSQPGRREDTYTDIVFSNQILEVTIDGYSGYMKSVKNLKQNLQADITQSFLWYQGMKGDNVGFDRRASGAYIFRPNGTQPLPLGDRANVKIYKGELVTEVHQIFSPWVTQVIRLYNNSQLLELDWVVGPIPVGDGVGKEVVTRFDSNLLNNGVFYTDLNGREVLNRIRNYRPTWNVKIQEPVSANYYPVNSRIYIIDPRKKAQLTIFNDRTQGGGSIQEGSIELMVHRRLLYDDGFGVGEPLNEPGENGKGLVVRGTHYLTLTSPEQGAVLQRETARQLRDQPRLTFALLTSSIPNYLTNYCTRWSALSSRLPPAVHLLTLEPWTDGSLLLRFEHIYEATDDPDGLSRPVSFSLQDVFLNLQILQVKELTLGANQYLDKASRLRWSSEGQPQPRFPWSECRREPCVTLKPMQIRTYLVEAQPDPQEK